MRGVVLISSTSSVANGKRLFGGKVEAGNTFCHVAASCRKIGRYRGYVVTWLATCALHAKQWRDQQRVSQIHVRRRMRREVQTDGAQRVIASLCRTL